MRPNFTLRQIGSIASCPLFRQWTFAPEAVFMCRTSDRSITHIANGP
jgi:hypothetical protein